MPKYKVTYEYRGRVTVEVDAVSEEDAECDSQQEADEIINGALTVYSVDVREVSKRPKDMTQAELDALPVLIPFRHPLPRLAGDGARLDDLAVFRGSDGVVYVPVETEAGWMKQRMPML